MSEALNSGSQPAAGGARPSVMQLVFREKGALFAAFIPIGNLVTRNQKINIIFKKFIGYIRKTYINKR